jgi:hypothetical protein
LPLWSVTEGRRPQVSQANEVNEVEVEPGRVVA